MIRPHVTFQPDLRAIDRRLRRFGGQATGAQKLAVHEAGEVVADEARRLAHPSIRRTIKVRSRARGGRNAFVRAEIYAGQKGFRGKGRLAGLFEFGTGPRFTAKGWHRGRMEARPFLRPALVRRREEALAAYVRALERILPTLTRI